MKKYGRRVDDGAERSGRSFATPPELATSSFERRRRRRRRRRRLGDFVK
jgi:hypothetical protein